MTQLRLKSHHTTDHRLEHDGDDPIITPCYRQVTIERGPDWWFSDYADERVAAEQICRTECPLVATCLLAGESERIGVWGSQARGWAGGGGRAKCKRCDRPMRPQGQSGEAFPGTVSRHSRTLCSMCAKPPAKAKAPPTKPSPAAVESAVRRAVSPMATSAAIDRLVTLTLAVSAGDDEMRTA